MESLQDEVLANSFGLWYDKSIMTMMKTAVCFCMFRELYGCCE